MVASATEARRLLARDGAVVLAGWERDENALFAASGNSSRRACAGPPTPGLTTGRLGRRCGRG
ncbi:hypothetical protein E1265_21120 [Streptomyces sp. 8K308]|uniref:hypothetical protein n=1 Tax=Streptomyces sp. 8K308 TaxID=2530388 RepID=UPI001051A185|nr:hypothetical protein [Streptomyces sp. 8K308]TDC20650.1 hypothetical protein E1265_21120 [Streptomyces sp. 8K308]